MTTRPHAIIVGVGPGMGLALARRFGVGGFRVSLVARRQETLNRYVAALRTRRNPASGYVADAGDWHELEKILARAEEEHGPCEVLIYNPAGRFVSPLADVEPEVLMDTLRINVVGALGAVRSVLPGMRERGKGTILFTGGGLAVRPLPNYGALAVGKAAQRSLAQTLALELKGTGVYVGTVLIAGYVQGGTAFDADRIAEEFWRLHTERPAKSEMIFRGQDG